MADGHARPGIADRTLAITAGGGRRRLAPAVAAPLQRASTILLPSARALYDADQVSYGRAGLEPQGALKEALARIEGGVGAHLFPNGVAAITSVLLALLSSGDELLAADCVYGRTRQFCDTVLPRFGIGCRYFDPGLGAAELIARAGPQTRLIFIESPGSLSFEIQDVPAIAAHARAAGLLTVIDNSWSAGLLFKPLAHGVDVSLQSLTKYVGGHSDCFMGAAVARDADVLQRLDAAAGQFGWSVSPDDAYQMLRGLRTLPVRLAAHGEQALAVAGWLRAQDGVLEVVCPALPGSRGHQTWARDFAGQNGLIGLVLRPAPEEAVFAFLDALQVFGLGYSWGGYESLAIACDRQLAQRGRPSGFGGPLIRLHVGLEALEDLLGDLQRGLAAYAAAS